MNRNAPSLAADAGVAVLAYALLLLSSPVIAGRQQETFGDSCPVQYSKEKLYIGPNIEAPLLLGGVWAGCTGGCQPRDDTWGHICQADPDALAIINVCEYWQRLEILEVADRMTGGAVRNFSPCDFYHYVKGRTLWLVGDSHTKNMFNALRCFLIDFFDHSDGECAASSNTDLQTLLEQTALRGHIYNTPPRCLHLKGGGRVCLVHNPMGTTMVSDDEQVLATLQLLHVAFMQPEDILVAGFGRWHSNNCAGVDDGYSEALEKVGAYLQKQRSVFPNVFFQPSDHDHTLCTNGTLNDTLPVCLPATQAGYDLGISAKLHSLAHTIMTEKYGIPVIDARETSMTLHNGHVMARQTIAGKTDCLHYCRPGMPELDIWYMTSKFAAAGIKQLSRTPDAHTSRQCTRVLPQNFKPFGATNSTMPVTVNMTVPAASPITTGPNSTANASAPAVEPGADAAVNSSIPDNASLTGPAETPVEDGSPASAVPPGLPAPELPVDAIAVTLNVSEALANISSGLDTPDGSDTDMGGAADLEAGTAASIVDGIVTGDPASASTFAPMLQSIMTRIKAAVESAAAQDLANKTTTTVAVPSKPMRKPIEPLFTPNPDASFAAAAPPAAADSKMSKQAGTIARQSGAQKPAGFAAGGATWMKGTNVAYEEAPGALLAQPDPWIGDTVADSSSTPSSSGAAVASPRQPVLSTKDLNIFKQDLVAAAKSNPAVDKSYQVADGLAEPLEPSRFYSLWPGRSVTHVGPMVFGKRAKQNSTVAPTSPKPNWNPWVPPLSTSSLGSPPGISPQAAQGADEQYGLSESGTATVWGQVYNRQGQALGDVYLVSAGGMPVGVQRAQTGSFVASNLPLGDDASYVLG